MSLVVIKVKTNSASPGREGGIIDDLRCMMLVLLFFFLFILKTSASSRAKQARPLLPPCAGSQ